MNDDMILIVDDRKFIAQTYSRVLLGLGYRVLIAWDGKTKILLLRVAPSLILLDMLMRDMDGLEVLRTLKRTPSTTNVPVLVTSSLSEKNVNKLMEEENAISGVLKKRLLVPSCQGSELWKTSGPSPRVDVPVRSARLVQLVHCNAGCQRAGVKVVRGTATADLCPRLPHKCECRIYMITGTPALQCLLPSTPIRFGEGQEWSANYDQVFAKVS